MRVLRYLGCPGVGSWEFPPGEGDHVPGRVPDGEDNPAPEDVVGAAPSGVGYSGLDRCFVVSEVVTQTTPLVGGPAELPFGPIGGFDSPLGEVAAGCVCCGGGEELAVVVVGAAPQ